MRYGSRRAAGAVVAAVAARGASDGGGHDRPQRGRLPADLAALLLALLRRRGHLRARQRDAPTARPAAAASSASRSPSDRVDHVWMAETLSEFQHRLLERYDVVLVYRRRRDPRSADPSGATLGAYIDRLDEEFVNPLGYEVLHLPGPRAAARSRPARSSPSAGYWFANDAYDKPMLATVPMTWVPGLARERRRPPQLRSGPAPDPPAPHGLRGLPRPPRRSAPGARWNERGRRRGLGRPTTGSTRATSSSAGSSTRPDSRARGSRSCSSAIPASVEGAGVSALRRLAGPGRRRAPTGSRSRPPHRAARALAAGGDERGGRGLHRRTRPPEPGARRRSAATCTPSKPWQRVRRPSPGPSSTSARR